MLLLITQFMTILVLIGFLFIWDMLHGRISLNSVLLLLLLENFVSRLNWNWCIIPHREYQFRPHLSPWFSAVCADAILPRNHFRQYQQNKSDSKGKSRQASNCYKGILVAAKLAYENETKEPIISQTLDSWDFWRIANSVLNEGKSAIPSLFNGQELLSFAYDKVKPFFKIFSENSSLDDSSISLPVFLSRTNLKLHNISLTLELVKKVIANLDLSKVSGPDCVPVVALKNCEPELL